MPATDATTQTSTLGVDIQMGPECPPLPVGAEIVLWAAAAFAAVSAARSSTLSAGSAGIRFVGRRESAALNDTWRQKAGPTNVLAFAGPELGTALPPEVPREYGDLVICLPVLYAEATEQGKTATSHLAHLVVHGTLHLLGYTHEGEVDAAQMEALETSILAAVGIDDPYVTE